MGSKAERTVDQFGDALRFLREQRGLTQQQLAEKTGRSKQHVSDLETGRRSPSFNLALAFADALSVSTDALRDPKRAAAAVKSNGKKK